jgi:hypothetical protein
VATLRLAPITIGWNSVMTIVWNAHSTASQLRTSPGAPNILVLAAIDDGIVGSECTAKCYYLARSPGYGSSF